GHGRQGGLETRPYEKPQPWHGSVGGVVSDPTPRRLPPDLGLDLLARRPGLLEVRAGAGLGACLGARVATALAADGQARFRQAQRALLLDALDARLQVVPVLEVSALLARIQ